MEICEGVDDYQGRGESLCRREDGVDEPDPAGGGRKAGSISSEDSVAKAETRDVPDLSQRQGKELTRSRFALRCSAGTRREDWQRKFASSTIFYCLSGRQRSSGQQRSAFTPLRPKALGEL